MDSKKYNKMSILKFVFYWCCCCLPRNVDYQPFNDGNNCYILTVHPVISFVIFFTWPSVNPVKGCTKAPWSMTLFILRVLRFSNFCWQEVYQRTEGPLEPRPIAAVHRDDPHRSTHGGTPSRTKVRHMSFLGFLGILCC